MTYTYKLNESELKKVVEHFKSYIVNNSNIYTLYTFKHCDNMITIYTTKKLLVQGKNIESTLLELSNIINITYENLDATKKVEMKISAIGSDEVGTGDFFGPIVVCSAYVNSKDENEILSLGVRDSKQITDEKIMEIAPILMKKVKYSYRILNNPTYNKLPYNMNEIKAIMHNFVDGNLYKRIKENNLDCDLVIIDGFCTQTKYFEYLKKQENVLKCVKLIPKAENSYTSVAVASIIARYLFLEEMNKLSSLCGYLLPKGASNTVDLVCAKIIEEKGLKFLNNICKLNFKNFEKAKEYAKKV